MDSQRPVFQTARAVWKPLLAAGALLAIAGLWLFALGSLADEPAFSPDDASAHPFVYLEFGASADTVWIASGADPSRRVETLTIPHAREYGVFASLSPDGKQLAYTALPPDTQAPDADSPAEVFVYAIGLGAAPARVGSDADLLVEPVWSPDGTTLVFRRSEAAPERAGDFSLVAVELATGQEQTLVATSDVALFPVAFTPDGGRLNFVTLSPEGSDLHAIDLAGGESRHVARLADDLTRDWRLAPAGDRLAYLILQGEPGRYSARVAVVDLETGSVAVEAGGAWDELGPAWTGDGAALTYGRLVPGIGGAAVLQPQDGATTVLNGPDSGFDVPLAWSEGGSLLAVLSFDGSSITYPGRASLALIGTDGSRRQVAKGEVTFVGWLN